MKTKLLLSFSIIIALTMLLANTTIVNSSIGEAATVNALQQSGLSNLVDRFLNFLGYENVYKIPADSISSAVNSVASVVTQQLEYTSTATPTLTATLAPTFTQTPIPTFTATPAPTDVPTDIPTAIPTKVPTAASSVVTVARIAQPSGVDAFAAEVRAQGMNGIWADGKFAYRFYSTSWGSVPGSSNTAALSSYEGHKAFFIHDYLGGNKLYNVGSGTRVAVIWQDRIDWFTISGVNRIAGTSTGNCGYTGPYSDWSGGNSYSAMDIISNFYDTPFAIQTCICSGDKAGVLILTGY